jgi:hypothetical protein
MGTVHPFQQPPRRPPADDWTRRVLLKQNRYGIDETIQCKANAVTILRNDPEWVDVLAFNELSQGIVCRYPPPWYLDDAPAGDPSTWAKVWTETDGSGRRIHELLHTQGCRVEHYQIVKAKTGVPISLKKSIAFIGPRASSSELMKISAEA